jgi:hypothetical protein
MLPQIIELLNKAPYGAFRVFKTPKRFLVFQLSEV